MRIEAIHFRNFKLLRDATLALEPLTVIVGPNGSGKSSVLDALRMVSTHDAGSFAASRTLGVPWDTHGPVEVHVTARDGDGRIERAWTAGQNPAVTNTASQFAPSGATESTRALEKFVTSFRAYALQPARIAQHSALQPGIRLGTDGGDLAGALDQLRDDDPEQWEAFNAALPRWLPEFDRLLFETPVAGYRSIALRAVSGGHRVRATQLSSGTLIALGLLTITYGEPQAAFIGIEEPESGLHPRLLAEVRDALFRIAYPKENGLDVHPRQVIVTTHSPYLLDLFRDVPECVVIAERHADRVTFDRLRDRPDIDEVLLSGPLGDAWYSGVLGGVPMERPHSPVYPLVRDGAG